MIQSALYLIIFFLAALSFKNEIKFFFILMKLFNADNFIQKNKKNCNWKNKNINNHIYFIYTKTMRLCSISLLHAFVICLGSMLMGHVGAYTSPTENT